MIINAVAVVMVTVIEGQNIIKTNYSNHIKIYHRSIFID